MQVLTTASRPLWLVYHVAPSHPAAATLPDRKQRRRRRRERRRQLRCLPGLLVGKCLPGLLVGKWLLGLVVGKWLPGLLTATAGGCRRAERQLARKACRGGLSVCLLVGRWLQGLLLGSLLSAATETAPLGAHLGATETAPRGAHLGATETAPLGAHLGAPVARGAANWGGRGAHLGAPVARGAANWGGRGPRHLLHTHGAQAKLERACRLGQMWVQRRHAHEEVQQRAAS